MVLICGIEEAGRGPVIGPLVMVGVLMEEKDLYKLERLKVKDSKMLTAKQREALFDKILEVLKGKSILIITPQEIDETLESDHLNLNWLEAIKTAEIINALQPDKAILDCPSPNIAAYESYVKKFLKNKEIELKGEHKAEKYPIVAAASILAKVTRDREVKKIEKLVGKDIGSGYPSDPVTQKFIKENLDEFPEIFRKTWITYKKLKGEKSQKNLTNF